MKVHESFSGIYTVMLSQTLAPPELWTGQGRKAEDVQTPEPCLIPQSEGQGIGEGRTACAGSRLPLQKQPTGSFPCQLRGRSESGPASDGDFWAGPWGNREAAAAMAT